jgi:hypothetical protein
MQAEQTSAEIIGLEGLRDRIEAWRGMRPRPRSMPEPLWSEAAAKAREVGVYRVARTLGLSFKALKGRAGSASTRSYRRRSVTSAPALSATTDFVEVKGLAPVSPAVVGQETVVEVVACDGARLSIRLKCASADVAALIHAFRGYL